MNRTDLITLLGLPQQESPSDILALELHYPKAIYRFNKDDQLKEATIDAPKLALQGKNVTFQQLYSFLVANDKPSLNVWTF